MPLPKIDQPLFPVTIPSTGKKTKFRPFTVKEEKILLVAQESKDLEQIVIAMEQIVGNCVLNTDVEELATFDIEYLLLRIRAKSVGEKVDFQITDPDTQEEVKLSLNIEDVEIKTNKEHKTLVDINDTVKLSMKYPKLDQLIILGGVTEETRNDVMFEMMTNCIDSVIEGDNVFKLEDFTKEEVTEFIDNLSAPNIAGIKEFFDTMPAVRHEVKYKNKNGDQKTFVVEGAETFFI